MLYRQALHNGWLQNHRMWAFWCFCLLKASHQNVEVTVGYQRIPLKAGQFIFGRLTAAKELKMTERQIRTCQSSLISTGNLSVKTSNKFSIITVINWGSYQGIAQERDSQGVILPVQQPTSGRPQTRSKEGKELKNISIPPLLDDVKAYCNERNRGVDPEKWFDFYQSKGWKVGKNKMKDWQASVRTWENSTQLINQSPASNPEIPTYMTDPAFDYEESSHAT